MIVREVDPARVKFHQSPHPRLTRGRQHKDALGDFSVAGQFLVDQARRVDQLRQRVVLILPGRRELVGLDENGSSCQTRVVTAMVDVQVTVNDSSDVITSLADRSKCRVEADPPRPVVGRIASPANSPCVTAA